MLDVSSKNHYELLGLERTASVDEIKFDYKEIARVYHPDSNFYSEIVKVELSPDELAVFQALTDAYNTLSNPDRRADYDKKLPKNLRGWENHESPPPGSLRPGGADSKRRVSEAFGVFGVVSEKKNPVNQVDLELERKLQMQSLVLKKRMKGGLFNKLLNVLGL